VIGAVSLYSPEDYKTQNNIAYMVGKEGWGVVYYSDLSKEDEPSAQMQVPEETYLQPLGNKIVIISTTKSSTNSFLQIVSKSKGIINSFWVESRGELINVFDNGESKMVCYLKNYENKYSLVLFDLQDVNDKTKWHEYHITTNYIEPLSLYRINDIIYISFRNGLATFDLDGNILSSDFFPLGEYFTKPPDIVNYDKYLIMSSSTSSLIFEKKQNTFWYLSLFLRTSGKIIIPLILFLLLLFVYQINRRQKRLLKAVLDLPSSGFMFVLDKNGRLLRANASGKNILGITNPVPLKRLFQYYSVLENTKALSDLVNKAIILKDSISQKINIIQDGAIKEWYCTVVPLKNIAGQYRGMVFTGIDITEELEKKRLSNWAQLAHDMQTNLSTIRLNAEQMDIDAAEGNNERRKKIIHQVNLLIQRVRDVVTVGRSDGLEMETVNAASICIEARVEFDESLFPNVEFELKILNFNISCDKQKMVRALRNAIENSIKALHDEPGLIRIACWNDTRNAFFSIKDTGTGMDEKTKEKILTPYFTTSKAQGGTGIGTMIMQHVIQLHGGELIINSDKGKGTEVIFSLPLFYNTQKIKYNKNQSV
jgi:two-component system phosphate regulon sensor histidine kinase PhoR